MRDRKPTKPNRVLVTPEDGTPFYAVLTRADEPTQEGTPLSKGNLLSDTAAALFGLTEDGTVNDALRLIGRFNNGLGNEWIFEKKCDAGYEVYPDGFRADIGVAFRLKETTYYVGNAYTYDASTGIYTLANPIAVTKSTVERTSFKYIAANISNITYINDWGVSSDTFYVLSDGGNGGKSGNVLIEVKNNPTYTSGGSGMAVTASSIESYSTKKIALTETTSFGYVNSPDEDAYSETPDDEGYYYKKIGRVGSAARIAVGEYTGTDLYGEDNPNVITFVGEPVFVRICSVNSNRDAAEFHRTNDTHTEQWEDKNGNKVTLKLTWNHNSLSFYRSTGYSSRESRDQLNTANTRYKYIAILA